MGTKHLQKKVVFILSVICLVPTGRAQQEEKVSDLLARMEIDMNKYFPDILGLSYDQLIQSEMFRRFGDLQNGVVKTIAALSYSGKQLNEINSAISEKAAEGWSETRFLSLNWTRYVSEKVLNDLKVQKQAIDMLSNYWSGRCEKKYFENYLALYDPVTLFPRDNFGPDIPLQRPPLYFGVSVSVSDQGGATGSTGLIPTDSTGAAIVSTTTVAGGIAGGIIGTAFPVVGNITGAFIGSVIGSLIGSGINYIVGAFKAHNEFKKQKEIRDRIRKFMIDSVQSLSDSREQLFLNSCANYVSKENSESIAATLKLLSERQQEMQVAAEQLNTYLEAEYVAFPAKLQTYLKDVELGYLAELSSRMNENQSFYLNDLLEVDKQSVLFQIKTLLPSVKAEARASSAIERLQAREELWQKKIVGDVLFSRTRDQLAIDSDRLGPWKESADYTETILKGAL